MPIHAILAFVAAILRDLRWPFIFIPCTIALKNLGENLSAIWSRSQESSIVSDRFPYGNTHILTTAKRPRISISFVTRSFFGYLSQNQRSLNFKAMMKFSKFSPNQETSKLAYHFAIVSIYIISISLQVRTIRKEVVNRTWKFLE